MLILIIGGAGSGKSLFAEKIASKLEKINLYYFATMQIYDEECKQRVLRHQQQRAEKNFITIETPFLENLLNFPEFSTGLLECLSNLLANMQFDSKFSKIENLPELINKKILNLYQNLKNLVIITNDIFADKIPENSDMKSYFQNLGKINCMLAEHAEIVIEINSGNRIIWKGENLLHEIMD